MKTRFAESEEMGGGGVAAIVGCGVGGGGIMGAVEKFDDLSQDAPVHPGSQMHALSDVTGNAPEAPK